MNHKKIIAAISAISVFSIATGASAFAANQIKEEKAEDSTIIEATTEAEADDEIVEDEVAGDEAVEGEEAVKPEKPEKPAKPVKPETEEDGEVSDNEIVDEENGEAEDEEKPEKPAKPAKKLHKHELEKMIISTFDFETADFVDEDAKAAWFEFCVANLTEETCEAPAKAENDKKPAKKADKEEIVAMIKNTFDLENSSFISDDTKSAWFEFCTANFVKAEKPVPPVVDENAEKPVPPVVDENAEKPVPPVVDENAEKPEPPAPPVVDENAEKPEPPAKPEKGEKLAHKGPHGHKNEVVEDSEVTEETTEAPVEETTEAIA